MRILRDAGWPSSRNTISRTEYFHRLSIEVRRSVAPPYRTALAQGSLDDVDGAMRRRLLDLIARKFGGPHRAARL
jgi:hypothetical protein